MTFVHPFPSNLQAVVVEEDFQQLLRILNTNVRGEHKVMFALTAIRGVGRRFSNIICKKADVDMNKRAGELTKEEIDKLVDVMQHPLSYKVPVWFLNRKRDIKTGTNSQLIANQLDTKLREDFERMRKIRYGEFFVYWGAVIISYELGGE